MLARSLRRSELSSRALSLKDNVFRSLSPALLLSCHFSDLVLQDNIYNIILDNECIYANYFKFAILIDSSDQIRKALKEESLGMEVHVCDTCSTYIVIRTLLLSCKSAE